MFKKNINVQKNQNSATTTCCCLHYINLVKYLRNLHALETKHDFFSQEIAAKQDAAATRFANTFSSKIVNVPVANCKIAACDVANFSFVNTGPGY